MSLSEGKVNYFCNEAICSIVRVVLNRKYDTTKVMEVAVTFLEAVAEFIAIMMKRRHFEVPDM